MIVTCVQVYVKPEFIDAFIRASISNHQYSTKEPGNLRFDILQGVDDPARFTLYEAYETDAAALAHKETAHYKTWRDEVASMMAKPREGIAHRVIAPTDINSWR